MSVTHAVKTQLGFAILFLLLGAGNIIFGTFKTHEYQELLSEGNLVVASPQISSQTGEEMPIPQRSAAKQGEYFNQIKAHFDFYLFVIAGGKWILALSGFFLLLALVGMRENMGEDS